MAHKNAEIAIEERLRTFWADRTPIFTENVQEDQLPTGDPFLQIQFPFADPRRWSVGTRHYREEGAARIVMSLPRGTGVTQMRDWGEELRNLFLDKKFDGVETQVPSDPLTDDRSDAGSFYVAYIAVPFTYQWQDE